jgi:hypothetical protein
VVVEGILAGCPELDRLRRCRRSLVDAVSLRLSPRWWVAIGW